MMALIKKLLRKVKNAYWRRKFCAFGDGTNIAKDAVIISPKYMTLGNQVTVSSRTVLQAFTEYRDRDVRQTLTPSLSIGNNVLLMRDVCIYCADAVTIEDDVTIAADVFITDENHGTDPRVGNYLNQPLVTAPVRICKGAWLGQKVSVMPGVTVGENAIIGAGAVVTRDIPANCMAVGIPARVVKQFDFTAGQWKNYRSEQ